MTRREHLQAKLERFQAELEDLEYRRDNFELDPDDYEDDYRDMLDETGTVDVCGLSYNPSHVLEEVDPTAYRAGLDDYIDSLDVEDDKYYQEIVEEISDLEDDIVDLEEELEELEEEEN